MSEIKSTDMLQQQRRQTKTYRDLASMRKIGGPSLVTLPPEMIANIASFLVPCALKLTGPTFDWTGELEEHRQSMVENVAAIAALLQSCRGMQNILAPYLYAQIRVGTWLQHSIPGLVVVQPNTSLLLRSLKANTSLQSHITTVHLQGMSFVEFMAFFQLPNIHMITIDAFNESEPLDVEHNGPADPSTVKELYLVNCGAKERPLAQLLSWPTALAVLYYQVDQGSWEDGSFTCDALERCIRPQKESLQRLVFNRCPPRDLGEVYVDVINFHGYTKLTSLSVSSFFLTGENQAQEVFDNLPPNLEELQVEYDDTFWVDFYRDDDSFPVWLFNLLLLKNSCMSDLQRVRIMAYCHDDENNSASDTKSESESDEDFMCRYCDRETKVQHPNWRPPKRLMDAFDAAQVCYSVYLNESVRYRKAYAGARDFEQQWEDDWVCSWG